MDQPVDKKRAIAMLWNQGIVSWKLTPVQKELYDVYHNAKGKTVVWSCARRLGKSFCLCVVAIEKCLQKPNAIVKFIAPTQKHIKTIVAPLIREIVKDCPRELRPEYRTADQVYRFKNGSEIQLAGTDSGHSEGLRGGSSDICIVDEAGFCNDLKYIIRSILIPTTTTTRGKILLSSTPPVSSDHDFEMYRKEAEFKGNYIKKTVYDGLGSNITQEIIDELLEEYDGADSPEFKREYLCELVTSEEHAVVPEFTEELSKEIVKEWPTPPFADRYVAGDIGFKDLTVFLFGYFDFKHNKLIVEDEAVMSGKKMTTAFMAEEIKRKEQELWTSKVTGEQFKPYLRVCDNNLIVINDLYKLHNLDFIPTAKDDKAAALNNMRIMIKEQRIIIHPRCKTLIWHLRNATWNRSRKSFDRSPDAGHYDACFVPGSKVITNFGLKNIEDIKTGDLVLTHKGNFKPVKQLLSRPYEGKILELSIDRIEPIKCTPDHKFLSSTLSKTFTNSLINQIIISNPDWVRADSLIIDTQLSSKSGLYFPKVDSRTHDIKTINSIEHLSYSGPVYSMEVEDDHSYTINGAAVKNCDSLVYLVRNVLYSKNPYPAGYGAIHTADSFKVHDKAPLSKNEQTIKNWLLPKKPNKLKLRN